LTAKTLVRVLDFILGSAMRAIQAIWQMPTLAFFFARHHGPTNAHAAWQMA